MQIKIYIENLVWFVLKLVGLVGLVIGMQYIPILSPAQGLVIILGFMLGAIILAYHLLEYIVPNPDKEHPHYLIEMTT